MDNILIFNVAPTGKVFTVNLDNDLSIIPEQINSAFCDNSSLFAWYGVLLSEAISNRKMLELLKQTEYNRLFVAFSNDIDENGKKKHTDKAIEALVRTDQAYIDICIKCIEAEKEENKLDIAVRAFEMRKDLLVSIGANLRKEINSDVQILKEKISNSLEK